MELYRQLPVYVSNLTGTDIISAHGKMLFETYAPSTPAAVLRTHELAVILNTHKALVDALRLADVALRNAEPIAGHYPEPWERHNAARAAVGNALAGVDRPNLDPGAPA